MTDIIRVINFEKFKKLQTMPRYPDNKDITENITSLDHNKYILVFISHCWLRGHPSAEGYIEGMPHPDNVKGDKYKLCISGIEKIKQKFAPGMKDLYVWLDFGCIDQSKEPAAELKQLDKIVGYSDIIFTPIVGKNTSDNSQVENWYEDYKNSAWNVGDHSYTNR